MKPIACAARRLVIVALAGACIAGFGSTRAAALEPGPGDAEARASGCTPRATEQAAPGGLAASSAEPPELGALGPEDRAGGMGCVGPKLDAGPTGEAPASVPRVAETEPSPYASADERAS